MRADILLIARIFPRPCGARKKYYIRNSQNIRTYVLYAKPSNKVYIVDHYMGEAQTNLSYTKIKWIFSLATDCRMKQWDIWFFWYIVNFSKTEV